MWLGVLNSNVSESRDTAVAAGTAPALTSSLSMMPLVISADSDSSRQRTLVNLQQIAAHM